MGLASLAILARLALTPACHDVVEFGCGYGTFTVPAAEMVSGTVHTIDLETEMTESTRARAAAAGLANLCVHRRDFVADGTGLPEASVDYAMLFNVLHAVDPVALLREACRVLVPGGEAGILHWNRDPDTPRGPPMGIRPRPEQCCAWAEEAGLRVLAPSIIALPPYHYGIVGLRSPRPGSDPLAAEHGQGRDTDPARASPTAH